MTFESMVAVAKAIAECSFITSELPVILSLEVHCSPKQQHALSGNLAVHLGSGLLHLKELSAGGEADTLSPHDLKCRVLVKGKVKVAKTGAKQLKKPSKGGAKRLPLLRKAGSSRLSLIISRVRATPLTCDGIDLPQSCRGDSARCTVSGRVDSERGEQSSRVDSRRESLRPFSLRSEVDECECRSSLRAEPSSTTNPSPEHRFVSKVPTHPALAAIITLRSVPFGSSVKLSRSLFYICSVNEDRLLKEYGLTEEERNEVEGLVTGDAEGPVAQRPTTFGGRAAAQLAFDPPPQVAAMQKRTSTLLMRPYPMGLRFSGANMNPLPCWLGGAQSVALNFSNIDLPLKLHFALFHGSGGFVLKPPEMVAQPAGTDLDTSSQSVTSWPAWRKLLDRTSIELLSLHKLPKRGEQRPRLSGRCAACHPYLPQLTGTACPPPNNDVVSSPSVSITLHTIGGVCAVSTKLPLPPELAALSLPTEYCTGVVEGNGLNAHFEETIHCVSSEPEGTFLRIGVRDDGREVAFTIAVLGRLRRGYRVFRLRSLLGVHIELAYLFVRISFGHEFNNWHTASALRAEVQQLRRSSRDGPTLSEVPGAFLRQERALLRVQQSTSCLCLQSGAEEQAVVDQPL